MGVIASSSIVSEFWLRRILKQVINTELKDKRGDTQRLRTVELIVIEGGGME
jgi:hypothetical protein